MSIKKRSMQEVVEEQIKRWKVMQPKKESKDEARKRINRTSAERKAFVRKYFNADITAPINYDLLINMDYISINGAVATAYNGIKNFNDN